MKALEPWQIDDIIKQKSEGKTYMQLAALYNCHYKTIENALREWRQSQEQEQVEGQIEIEEFKGYSLKVLLMNDKTMNFDEIGKYEKLVKLDIWQLYDTCGEVVAIFEARNVSGIVAR